MILLMAGGVDFFDALCHAFATLATGGFSTHTASIAYFDSAYVEGVIIVFMLLAGMNFTLHFHAFTGNFRTVIKNEELRLYLAIVFLSTLIITVAATLADPAYNIVKISATRCSLSLRSLPPPVSAPSITNSGRRSA